jgi:hypothetical protein
MAIHRTEEGTARDARLFNPSLHTSNRAGVGIGAVPNPDLPSLRLLIDLAPAERGREAILPECAIRQVQSREF